MTTTIITYDVYKDMWTPEHQVRLDRLQKRLSLQGGCFDEEIIEQQMSMLFLQPQDHVVELGGNIGRNSMILAGLLEDSSKMVVFESLQEESEFLRKNRDQNGFQFHVSSHALSDTPLMQQNWVTLPAPSDGQPLPPHCQLVPTMTFHEYEQVLTQHQIRPTVLVADCEGALGPILESYPQFFHPSLRCVLLENDFADKKQKQKVHERLESLGFRIVYQVGIQQDTEGGWGHVDDFWVAYLREMI